MNGRPRVALAAGAVVLALLAVAWHSANRRSDRAATGPRLHGESDRAEHVALLPVPDGAREVEGRSADGGPDGRRPEPTSAASAPLAFLRLASTPREDQDRFLAGHGVEVTQEALREALDDDLRSGLDVVGPRDRLATELWNDPGALVTFRELQLARALLRESMGTTGYVLWHSFWEWEGPCDCGEGHGDLWEDTEVSAARALFDTKHMQFRDLIPPELREGGF